MIYTGSEWASSWHNFSTQVLHHKLKTNVRRPKIMLHRDISYMIALTSTHCTGTSMQNTAMRIESRFCCLKSFLNIISGLKTTKRSFKHRDLTLIIELILNHSEIYRSVDTNKTAVKADCWKSTEQLSLLHLSNDCTLRKLTHTLYCICSIMFVITIR